MNPRLQLSLLVMALSSLACSTLAGGESLALPDPLPVTAATLPASMETPPTKADEPAVSQNSGLEASPLGSTGFKPDGLLPGPGTNFVVLDNPVLIPASEATWISPVELVLGVEWSGQARAYPVSQIAYHHIVNDSIEGNPLLVTY